MADAVETHKDPEEQEAPEAPVLETLEEASVSFSDPLLFEQIHAELQNLRLEDALTDVVLMVQQQSFSCHRALLAATSLYFRAMFCNDLRERREECVNIRGVGPAEMRLLLEYTYTSKVLITKENVQKLLEASSQFQFPRVTEACGRFLADSLHPENCVGVLLLAEAHSLSPLWERARDFIVQHFSSVAAQEELPELGEEVLLDLLRRDELGVTREEQVYRAAMRWVRARPGPRAPALPRLLARVRLPLLDPSYYVREVEGDELIRSCPGAFPLLQEARRYHLAGEEVICERTKPRLHQLQSEVFVIVGGCTQEERFVSEVTCLDPLRRSRLEVARLPGTDAPAANRKWVEFACITFRNELYLSGGKETQQDVWKYDAYLNKWIQVEDMSGGRWRHKMAVLGGKVYVLGGFNGVQRLSSVEAYDPFHNSWAEVAPLLIAVSSFSAASLGGAIYVMGGGPDGRLATGSVQRYDSADHQWALKSPMPIEAKCTNAVAFRERVYVVGGAMGALYAYSPGEDAWTLVTQLGGERASCGISACCDRLFISGGRDESNALISTVLCWDPRTGTLTEECVLPRPVSHHGSVTLRKSYTHVRKITVPAD